MQASTPTPSRPRGVNLGPQPPWQHKSPSLTPEGPLQPDREEPHASGADRAGAADKASASMTDDGDTADADVAAAWANQLAAVLDLNQDLEDKIVTLRQQNMSLKRCGAFSTCTCCGVFYLCNIAVQTAQPCIAAV